LVDDGVDVSAHLGAGFISEKAALEKIVIPGVDEADGC